MDKQTATRLAEQALENTTCVDPTPVEDTTVLFRNPDGSWSVCDNGEEVVCRSAAEAIRIMVENLTAKKD